MTRPPKRDRVTEAPPELPRSGGRWLRAADGSLSRAATEDDNGAPAATAAPVIGETS